MHLEQSIPDLDLEALLTGKYVRLWPYAPGHAPRDILYRLWLCVEQDGEAMKLLHGAFEQPCKTPVDGRGDLGDFVRTVGGPGVLLIAQHLDRDEIAGFVWFGDVQPKFAAWANIYARKSERGAVALELGYLSLRYMFVVAEMKTIWGRTPWPNVAKFAGRWGFERAATLPDAQRIEGKTVDVHLLRLTRERFVTYSGNGT